MPFGAWSATEDDLRDEDQRRAGCLGKMTQWLSRSGLPSRPRSDSKKSRPRPRNESVRASSRTLTTMKTRTLRSWSDRPKLELQKVAENPIYKRE